MTNLIRLFCSVFQFSAFFLKNQSVSYRNKYLDFEVRKGALLALISALVIVQGLYLALMVMGFFSLGNSRNLKSMAGIFYFLGIVRVVVSKVCFLPIFQLLSYTISCSFYEEFGTRKCSLDRRLGCVMTSRAKMDVLETLLLRFSVLALIWHVLVGLISELFDFSIECRDNMDRPK